jgi:hypothetical protein
MSMIERQPAATMPADVTSPPAQTANSPALNALLPMALDGVRGGIALEQFFE